MVLSGPPKPGGFWVKLKKEKMQSDFTNECIMNENFPVTTPFGLIRKTQDFLLILEFYVYIHYKLKYKRVHVAQVSVSVSSVESALMSMVILYILSAH